MFTQFNKRLAKSLTLAVILALMVVGLALADVVINQIDKSPDDYLEPKTIVAGSSTTVGFYIKAVTIDDANGCNVASSTPATVYFNIPVGVTASPTSLTFGGCGAGYAQTIEFSSSRAGTYEIEVASVTGGKVGSNWDTAPASFNLIVNDITPPVITPNVSGTIGNNGWYTSDVTVSWTVIELESDVSSSSGCDPTSITTDTSGTTLTCTATSAGGTSSESVTIKRDATPPTVALVDGPADGGSYIFGSVPAAPTCSEYDALSGLDGVCSVSGYSGLVGDQTVTASAADLAGNIASISASYTVLPWTLNGFYQPVDMGDVWNIVKGGSTVPFKFEVFAGAMELTDTAVVSSFVAAPVACPLTGVIADAIEITTTGVTSLRYDLAEGQFINNWQTPKKPGACYLVTMTTQDGSSLAANFKLK